jgi:2-polyprenyl-6-methoxyphenol hydroxylase-like FAD-dependent oxidoreductase
VGAYVLAGELAKAQGDYTLAFSEYERSLRPFVKKNQDLSGASVTLMTSPWVVWLMHQSLRILPNWTIQWMRTWGSKRVHEAASDFILPTYSQGGEGEFH